MRTWAEISPRHRAAYKPCPVCEGPCGLKSEACRNCTTANKGERHYAWKGDAARSTTKRERAQLRYQLGPCERCEKQATDRHHIDGDTGNNVPENITILCRRCHMEIDGRLARLRAMIPPVRVGLRPCGNCRRMTKPLRRGRCHACNEYLRRVGVERPAALYSKGATP